MKLTHLIITTGVIGLFSLAMPAYAADSTTAGATTAAAGDAWSDADIKRLCTNRFPNKPKKYAECLTKNNSKLGKAKTADDVKMIETGKDPHKKAAAGLKKAKAKKKKK